MSEAKAAAENVWRSKGAAGAGGGKRVITILIFLLAFLLLSFLAFGYGAIKDRQDKEYITLAGEQEVLSQRLAKQALEAVGGKTEAFSQLGALRKRFSATVNAMRNGDDALGLPPLPKSMSKQLSEVETVWGRMHANIQRVLQGRETITNISEYVNTIGEMMPKLVGTSSNVAETMVKKGASPDQVYLATRQLMLAQRLANNANSVLAGKGNLTAAADQFSKDSNSFGEVLEGMLQGDSKRGVSSVKDPEIRRELGNVAMLFKTVSDNVGGILDSSEDLDKAQAAARSVASDSDALLEASEGLEKLFSKGGSTRQMPNWVGYLFTAVTVVLLVLLVAQLITDARRRTNLAKQEGDRAAEQNRRNQAAIMQLLDEMGDLADGDLTVQATVSEDITGAIADSINYTIEQLRHLVQTINDTALQVSSAAQESQTTAVHLAEASDHQASQITQASAAVNEMAVSIQDVSKHAAESADVAERSVGIAHKGAETVRATIEGMDTIREQIQETSKRIKRLGESSQEIGDIVELINDIADQTNILALNAAIQAAMAGEAGRGFAVVADEVQRLAERSGNATKQIEALVKTIQSDTNEAVISMEQSTANVVSGANLAENAGAALGEIENVSRHLADLIETISESASQQSNAAANISDTMNVIQEITTQTSAGTQETAASIGNLAELANDLRKSVSDFKLPEEE